MTDDTIEIAMLGSLTEVAQQDWDACACPEAADGGRPDDPFTTWRFLKALEESGSVGAGSGWQPRYLTATQGGQLIACAPMYAKVAQSGRVYLRSQLGPCL